jgi:hypothetical protein
LTVWTAAAMSENAALRRTPLPIVGLVQLLAKLELKYVMPRAPAQMAFHTSVWTSEPDGR